MIMQSFNKLQKIFNPIDVFVQFVKLSQIEFEMQWLLLQLFINGNDVELDEALRIFGDAAVGHTN